MKALSLNFGRWLAPHRASERELWAGFFKKHAGRPTRRRRLAVVIEDPASSPRIASLLRLERPIQ